MHARTCNMNVCLTVYLAFLVFESIRTSLPVSVGLHMLRKSDYGITGDHSVVGYTDVDELGIVV